MNDFNEDDDLVGGNAPPVKATKQAKKARTEEARAKPGSNSGKQLSAFITRIIALEDEKRALAEDVKQVYAQVHGEGFDKATVREMVKLTQMDPDKRQEREALRDMYLDALDLI